MLASWVIVNYKKMRTEKRLPDIYTFTLNIIVFNATLSTSVFTLVLQVSATLVHHQVLLLLLLQLLFLF
jgi:hypothetical protein